MRNRSAKNLGLVGCVAGVAVVALASAAFACTELVGRVTITGINGTTINGTSNGSATYYGNGGDFDLSLPTRGYCGGLPTSRTAVDTGTGPLDFRLTVAAYTCSTQLSSNTKSPLGTYEVRWVKAETAIDTSWEYPVCHYNVDDGKTTTDNPTSRWVVLGTMDIDANGDGSGEYPLPSTMFGPGNICVEGSQVLGEGSVASAPPTAFINKVNLI